MIVEDGNKLLVIVELKEKEYVVEIRLSPSFSAKLQDADNIEADDRIEIWSIALRELGFVQTTEYQVWTDMSNLTPVSPKQIEFDLYIRVESRSEEGEEYSCNVHVKFVVSGGRKKVEELRISGDFDKAHYGDVVQGAVLYHIGVLDGYYKHFKNIFSGSFNIAPYYIPISLN